MPPSGVEGGTLHPLLSEISRHLLKELAVNCKNTTVFGGLENLAKRWVGKLKLALSPHSSQALRDLMMKLVKLQSSYSSMRREDRRQLLEDILGLLEELMRTREDEPREHESPSDEELLRKLRMRLKELQETSTPLSPDAPVRSLRGVGVKLQAKLRKLGVYKLIDLLYLYPRKYLDRRTPKGLKEVLGGSGYLLVRVIGSPESSDTSTGKRLTRFPIKDHQGTSGWLVFFNQPFIVNRIRKGMLLRVYGRVDKFRGEYQLIPEEWEPKRGKSESFDRILPIYPLTEGLSQRQLRNYITLALQRILPFLKDFIPGELRERERLLELREALALVHAPLSWELLKKAKRRLAFQEALIPQLALMLTSRANERTRYVISEDEAYSLLREFKNRLPFKLTGAQERALRDVQRDLSSGKPMRRLLQGDVGSGKTVVAAAASLLVASKGWQVAVMAPTEVLALQHFQNFKRYLEPFKINVELLTGRLTPSARREVLRDLREGRVKVIVGTHALFSKDVEFNELAMVIIDEQHKFGVKQRTMLYLKGETPHLLVMTATPIPRTMVMTVYADLSLSIIDEMPPGRRPVITKVIPFRRIGEAYEFIRELLNRGERAYIVCPAIDESSQSLRTVMDEAKHIREEVFPEFNVGILHGKMSSEEKEAVIDAFKRGELQVLVSTTVVEVGVDVPDATVIMVLNADRFGLAQLHQLRGRVGRGDKQSYAIFVASPRNPTALERLKTLEIFSDGFSIAQKDLELRGPGELIGHRQHGYWDFKMLDPIRDLEIIERARELARELISEGTIYRYTELLEEVKRYIEDRGLLEEEVGVH